MSQQEQEEVVISGVGGFFPRAENLEKLKEVLLSNEILLDSRWKEGERGVSNRIGVCPSIEYFDTAFFGIHRQQATFMDPMQRLMLERTYEALVDAGVNPQDVRGKRIGCYMGSSIGENDNLFYESIVSGFGVTGHSRAMMPNRISYWLNLKGPSCAYDSNWINGIEVLQMGFDAVREGHCEAAIVGTANLALNSEISWLYNDMSLLSPDGSTKAFDAEATGYARSDGIVVFYIQRAVDAKRSYATIVGTSTQFNGFREGTLLDLDQPSMVNFMNEFYNKVNVNPKDVSLMECYGCGIRSTDEAELNAIDEVYCKNRKNPLMIGSVKTNSGHSEATSNLTSIAKVLVAMETGKIPATLQYKNPNPNIPGLVNGRMEVVTENRDWDGGYAAINGIGLSSSYAHCLLKSNPKLKTMKHDNNAKLVIASTRTETGIDEVLDTVKNQPVLDDEYIALTQELFSKSIPGHLYRGYSILDKDGEIKRESEYHSGNKRQTWFVFSGMGSQWCGMAKDLMGLPMFAKTIMKCHKALEKFDVNLLEIVTSDDPKMFDNILHSFVGIAAIQIALTDILKALGITPDGIIGHSVGELGCAYADNCMTAEQMILCAYSRGRASLEAELIPGMMAAVGMGYNQIKSQVPEPIEVACHNSADSSTISGPREDMEKFVKELQDRGVFARLVNVANIAYHSRYIKPAAPFLLKYLKNVIPKPMERSSKWISTSVPEANWDTEQAKTSSPEYHTNNLLSSVLFEEGSKHIPKDSVCIEIAPHGLLQAILKKSLKSGCTNIPLTQRGSKNGIHFLLSAIGKIYLAGLDVDVAKIFPNIEYPVSKGTCGLAPLANWEHGETWRTGIEDKLNYLVSVKDTQIALASPEFKHCIGHQLDERILLPLSSTLTIILKILSTSKSIEISEVVFENIRFRNIIQIPKVGTVPFYGMVQKGTGEFEILSKNTIIATGRVTVPQSTDKFMMQTYDVGKELEMLSNNEIYGEFLHRGHEYDGDFKALKNIRFTENGSIGAISGGRKWQDYLEAMMQINLFKQGEKRQNTINPVVIQRINISIPNLPIDGDKDVLLTYDYSTGITSTPGLQLCGVETAPLANNPKLISYDSLEFVPYEGTICDNIETALNYSVHLTIENFPDLVINNIVIIEIANKGPSIVQQIKNVTEKYTQMHANISSVSDPKITVAAQNDPILIVSDEEIQEATLQSLTGKIFMLGRTSKVVLSKNIHTVAQYTVDNVKYSLIRKVDAQPVKIIKVSDCSTKELLQVARKSPSDNIFAIIHSSPTEGIPNFISQVRSENDLKLMKFTFVLDKNEMNPDDALCKKIVAKNCLVTVVKKGITGTYLPVSIDFKANVKSDVQLSSNIMVTNKLSYISVNLNNESLKSKYVGLGNIDYVAVDKKGNDIMGLSKFDDNKYNLVPDYILSWKIPDNWSKEDACTIPHAYATAYHSLIQRAQLQPGENVLIHSGCSAIGYAAISIAANKGCTIFTTVATDWQKAFLKTNFSCLRDRNILNSENASFEPYLLTSTGGVGVHVILNNHTGRLLDASIRCLGEYGRFVQLGKLDNKQNNTIGMSVFLKNTSVTGVIPENIFELDETKKTELRDLVQDGIANFVVRPLHRKVVTHQDVSTILTNIADKSHIGKILIKLETDLNLKQLNINGHNQFICSSNASHLVYGEISENAIDMIEWLVLRGARKIMLCCKINHNRRLNLLKKYFNVEIVSIANKTGSKEGVTKMVSSLYALGPIQGVYILPGDMQPIENLDAALRNVAPKAFIVNFLSAAAGILQNRSDSGFLSFNVQWDDGLKFGEVLSGLDDVLSYHTSNILIKNNKVSEVDQETPQALYKKLALLLPLTATDLCDQSQHSMHAADLVQLPTAGPRRIRELPPVILIPGVSGIDKIREFAKELLYPTFYTQMGPEFMTIENAGKLFAEKIRALYKRGPYNLIGISTGGILAIEIANHLQQYANTQITLVDGAPDTMQAAIKYLGEDSAREVNLINRILNISNAEKLKELSQMRSWEERLAAAVDATEGDNKDIMKEAMTLLKKKLDDLSRYKPKPDSFKGELHLIRPLGSSKTDNCGLSKYIDRDPQVYLITGDHNSILNAPATLDIINEKVTVI